MSQFGPHVLEDKLSKVSAGVPPTSIHQHRIPSPPHNFPYKVSNYSPGPVGSSEATRLCNVLSQGVM